VVVMPLTTPELATVRRQLGRWIRLCAAMVVLASLATLMIRATTMAGGRAALAFAALPVIVTRPHFGAIWCARLLAAVALVVVAPLGLRPTRVARLIVALGIALTTSLTGHAADAGAVTVRVVADWAHVASSAMWLGGLFGLAAIVLRDAADWPGHVVGVGAARFSRLGGGCLGGGSADGSHNCWSKKRVCRALSHAT